MAVPWFGNGYELGSEPHAGQVSDPTLEYIGWSGWSSEYFEINIDDVQMFNKALNEHQRDAMFQDGIPHTISANLASRAELSF
ncbi:hypothetical protein LCGC14_0670970 [marine sediment metagenome]|uniref:Uncharacterized protein n=2 Tax=root TaxID=1 RepID=A0A831QVN2_9FLAO|nr:hypothetical protein [Pricia antarctica]